MELDALILARMQFAFTVAFHIVFPAFSIGLASYLAVLEALWLKTGRDLYLNLFKYWLKIFAVAFGMGVVSGLVMSYQFGTNWSVFSDKAGPVIGPLMAYEVLSAFFLEAGFLGVMLFGLDRVGKKLHFMATLMVAIGTFASAFWILSVNSWMQTPQGYAINEVGQFVPADWIKIVFNPSFPYRLAHMLLAAYLTTGLVVGAVGAWHLIKERTNKGAREMFAMAMGMILVAAPVQIFIGDMHGLNTLEHQPAKVMAMEGHFESHPDGAPLILFGLPDREAATVHGAVEIPNLSSLILKHDPNAPLAGLDTIARADWPPVEIVFWSFRIMVGLGMAMLLLGLWGLYARLRKRLYGRALAAPLRPDHGADGLRRRPCGLDHHRSWPPTLDDLRPAAHRRQRCAPGGARRRNLPGRLRRGLFHGVRRRGLLHPASDEPCAASRRAGRGGNADPHGGHHPRPRHRPRPSHPDRRGDR